MAKTPKNTTKDLQKIIQDADAATKLEDLEAAQAELQRLLGEGFVEAEATKGPYTPALEMTEAFRERYMEPEKGGTEGGVGRFVGGLAVDVANALANAERRVAYRLKVLFGFDGLRIVEEGDSWTQYPILLEDIVDHLSSNDDIAVFSLGAAGDLVRDMAAQKDYLRAIKRAKATAMLLSGGGNDLFGDLGTSLLDYQSDSAPEALINEAVFGPIFLDVMNSYRTILADVAAEHPGVVVFGHGYDLPFPEDDGNWIGPVLKAKDIPFDVGRQVLKVIMDRFNDALAALADDHAHFVYCDLRGEVDRGANSWYDELHPKNAGYARAASVIEARIRSHGAGQVESAKLGVPVGGSERSAAPTQTIVLDPGHGGTAKLGGSSANNAVGPNGTLEKTLTLDIALRAGDILTDRGFNVILTRDSDVNIGLRGRAAVAQNSNAAAFVSIHFNGSTGHNAQGTETFVHASLDTGDGASSKALCRAVQAEMVAALGLRDRNEGHVGGIKYGNFGVLNPSNHACVTAAILHEVSFLDRADEEARLGTVSYRRKIATALADGIENHLDRSIGAERTHLAMEEMEDGFELASADLPAPIAAQRPRAMPFAAVDISNGHEIAGPDPQGNLAEILAGMEARHVQNTGAEGEGNEPSDFDSNVESVFSGMTTNAQHNAQLLRGLFGGVESSGFDHAGFEAFINGLGLRHFSPGEFLVLGNQNTSGPCAGKNTLPPQSLWPRLAQTARMLDEIRHRLNAPVFISSAYRSPAYNSCIGGAQQSQHMNFNALDWRCTTGTPANWFAVANQVRASSSAYSGFIQQYDTFVHIDTRNT